MDPSNIPWHQAGVNYVIEATESLKKKVDGTEHLKPKDGLVKSPTMKDLVNRKGSESCAKEDRSSEGPGEVKENEGEKGGRDVTNGVRRWCSPAIRLMCRASESESMTIDFGET